MRMQNMKYIEILIPFFDKPKEPLRVICHRLHSFLKNELKIEAGCFVDDNKIICRTWQENREILNLNLSKIKKNLSMDWIFLKEENIPKQVKSVSLVFNYGENSLIKIPRGPLMKKLKKNKTHYALYRLLEDKGFKQLGGSTGKEVFPVQAKFFAHPQRLFEINPHLQAEKIEYKSGKEQKKFYLRIVKVFMVNNLKITNYEEFNKLFVLGFGSKKSYGCGLIQITT